MKNWSEKLKKTPNTLVIGCLYLYQKIFSPSLGILRILPFYPKNTCIFYPTCSEYAVLTYKKDPFFTATRKTLARIARCRSHNTPRIDYP